MRGAEPDVHPARGRQGAKEAEESRDRGHRFETKTQNGAGQKHCPFQQGDPASQVHIGRKENFSTAFLSQFLLLHNERIRFGLFFLSSYTDHSQCRFKVFGADRG